MAASRRAEYSRSMAFTLDGHSSRSRGILSHLLQNRFQCLLGERSRRDILDYRDERIAWEWIMDVPPICALHHWLARLVRLRHNRACIYRYAGQGSRRMICRHRISDR